MTYLLDTNALVVHLRSKGRSTLSRRLRATPPNEIVVCSIVRAELRWGALRSQNRVANLTAVELLLVPMVSLPFDDRCADRHAELRQILARIGAPIGAHDLLIAAIALANGLILVTHNTAEFSRVPALKIEDWEI